MAKLKLYFSYDGTRFHGFQRQRNTPQTIQEVFESKLSSIFDAKIKMMASGRTDAGVHARIQVVHIEVPDAMVERMMSSLRDSVVKGPRLLHALNSLLPHDIRLLKVER